MWLPLFLLPALAATAWAHGRVLEPPSRASAWRFGYPVPPNYDDDGLNCGGYSAQHSGNKGKCGICGDPYNVSPPRPHELGGMYGVGIITGHYQQGGLITTTVDLTTSHRGFWEFKLCPDPESNEQACFDRYVLEHEGGGTKYYPDRGSIKYNVTYKLPNNLVCEHCVLQWRYTAGNNWGSCGNGTSMLGCGPQEQFGACSDISIGNSKGFFRGGENDVTPLVYYLKNGYFDAQQGILHMLRGKVQPNTPGSQSPKPNQPRPGQPNLNQIPNNQRPTQQPTGPTNERPVQNNPPTGQLSQRPIKNGYPTSLNQHQHNSPTGPSNQNPVQYGFPTGESNVRPVQSNRPTGPSHQIQVQNNLPTGLSNNHVTGQTNLRPSQSNHPTGPTNQRLVQNNTPSGFSNHITKNIHQASPSNSQGPKQNLVHPNSIQAQQNLQSIQNNKLQNLKNIQYPYKSAQQVVSQSNSKGQNLHKMKEIQQLQQLQHIQQLIQQDLPNNPYKNIRVANQPIKHQQNNHSSPQNEKLIQQTEIQHYYNKKHHNQHFQNKAKRKRQPRGKKHWKTVKYGIPHKRKHKKGKHRKKKKKVAYYGYY